MARIKIWCKLRAPVLIWGGMIFLLITNSCKPQTGEDEFDRAVAVILSRISIPEIPQRDFLITEYGDEATIRSDCKPAIDAAIAACAQAGGGRVVIPPGSYECHGPIHLRSKINLHLKEGALLNFSQNAQDYLPVVFVRWEGTECYNYSPYIYARDQTDIAITGKGRFNARGRTGFLKWRPDQKASQLKLRLMGQEGVPLAERVFGEGYKLRPSFIELIDCERVLISDVIIEDTPFWVVHPVYCKSVTVRGIKVNSFSLNSDGVDPDSSEDVLIEDCWFNTGDDAVAVKAGRDQDAWRVGRACRNIVVRNCHAEHTLHGVAFGSEMSGGVEGIYVDKFTMGKVDQYAVQFKANKDRGGWVKDIHIRGVEIDTARTAIYFTNDYHSYSGGDFPSEFGNITIRDFLCRHTGGKPILMQGLQEKPIYNVKFHKVVILSAKEHMSIENTRGLEFLDCWLEGSELNLESQGF